MRAMEGAMQATDFWLIRHAPVGDGRLSGRRDPAATVDSTMASTLAAALGRPDRLLASPARRCLQTAAALWPDLPPETDPRLWEQDFGAWEGRALTDLPDLGPLSPEALAAAAPHGGECFADLVARTIPALEALATGGSVAVVAHAGTVRAALARALGHTAGALAFQVAPLSLTCITATPAGWSVACVNRVLA